MKIISRILTLNLIFWAIFILPLGYLFVAAGKLFAPSGKYAHAMARRYLAMIAILLFAFGVIAQQNNMIQIELWRLKQDLWWANQERNRGE